MFLLPTSPTHVFYTCTQQSTGGGKWGKKGSLKENLCGMIAKKDPLIHLMYECILLLKKGEFTWLIFIYLWMGPGETVRGR